MKNYSSLLKGALAAITLAVAVPSFAAEYDAIQDGQTITLEKSTGDKVWSFTAPYTGLLEVQSTSNSWYAYHSGGSFMYTSADHDLANVFQVAIPPSDNKTGKLYTFAVEEGVTYYVYFGVTVPLPIDNVNFTFTMKEGTIVPEVAHIYPAPNATSDYNFAEYPQVQLIFNVMGFSTTFENVSFNYVDGDGNAQSVYAEPRRIADSGENRWDIDVISAIKKAKATPAGIKKNSPMSIVLESPKIDGTPVTGQYINAEGNLVLDYQYGNLVMCTDDIYPTPMMSYWPADSEDGLIKLTFDDELMPMTDSRQRAYIMIFAGPYREPSDGDDTGWPELPVAPIVIDGNTLSVDLRGVQRPAEGQATALAILKETPIVSIWIQSVLDINGKPIDFNGSPAIQINDIPFTLLEEITLSFDVTPASGSLTNTNEIEVWTLNETFNHVRFDGFTFSSEETTVTVTDFTQVPDPLDATASMLYIPVPDAIKAVSGEVILTFNLYSLDGYEYSYSQKYENQDSGVETIEGAEAGRYTVYNANGVHVLTGTASEVNALPAGLYIINGKKVIK